MSFITCKDIAHMVLEEVTEQLAPSYCINDLRYQVFEYYCSIFDSVSEEMEGQSFGVDVDPADLSVRVILVCPMITVEDSNHMILELIMRCRSFAFEPTDDPDFLSASFFFPSLWVER